jgi:PKD repeat protein/uncharacterized protein YneF (UPF0154 family)
MALVWNGSGGRGGTNRWMAAARTVVLAVALGIGLNVLTLVPVGSMNTLHIALACGLVNPYTIVANGSPSLAFPGSLNPNPAAPFVPPPAAGILAQQYDVGQPVKFVEDISRVPNPPNLSALQVHWTFGDGTAPSAEVSPTHTFAKPGTYFVHFQQYDSYVNPPWDDVDSTQIQVIATSPANPPVARITADKTAIVGNDSITFDATSSHALVGSHLTYQWEFNDGSKTASGLRVTHQFTGSGSTFVALIVTDDRGARSVATINVGIVNNAQQIPTASLSASVTSASVGQAVGFDASQSQPASDPPGDQLTQYRWDFGDGTPTQTTQTPNASHVFQHPGNYTVTVQATDQQGTPAQATISLTISAAASSAGSGGSNWLAIAGGAVALLVLAVGGFFFVRDQRRQALTERQQLAALELRRAHRVPQGGVRPGDPRWGDPRAGGRGASRTSGPGGHGGGAQSGAARQLGTPRDTRRGPPPGS